MINKIILFSIKNKLIIGLLTLALIIFGIWSINKIPLDAVPDITNNQVQIIAQAPNLGTEDIEQFITYPIELSMANLPGVKEIRSISRFGLSLVTIVFEDDMGTYLPRQLISENLKTVKEKIPKNLGEIFMGPISTGLGEIYQYTLEVDPAWQNKYSTTDLRTIQDWIVKRQMAMIKGVIEINSFGGHVKLYEVGIDPNKLKSFGLTISQIFSALKKSNQNTGGGYIEKNHHAIFIRSEGLTKSIEDIENIVITNQQNIPIKIKDIAKVKYGKTIRYGAFSKNGKGESIGGTVFMLKGSNSNKVIKAVKKRIENIQKSMPKGVKIKPFLDRSNLIKQTTNTISENLIVGALIVIFVLVFLLGNWRGGIIIASTIPLSLLFAFILMNIFGVWANLMSLGAIDFGIIIDGSVIIIESTVFLLHEKVIKKGEKLNSSVKNEIAYSSSSKMMNTAFFGQLIILIVFIPILALQGIEGKMFKPMALTFVFAMAGVMLLCLTYVPMMSSWFIKINKKSKKKSIGERLIIWLENLYESLLKKVLKNSKWVLISTIALFILSLLVFSKTGGEFIPQLDEGDIALHMILKPGSSLSESIKASTKIEKLLLEKFPEIKNVMTRVGVSELPTDPMPMDIGDCFILLKQKNEWVSAKSKSELIKKIKEVINTVPGISYEFSQPIEMRFNELITGVREDIAIKIFGEDLDILAQKAEKISRIIKPIQGVSDMRVEATKGLPQITIKYNFHKLAQYGLFTKDINEVIQSAFAGKKAGVIFEGEKRFDLVVRFDKRNRKNIEDVKNIYVSLPGGAQIPLKEVADISYQTGPMQISRDNTNRRVYVGINVRDRDIKSLVEEIQNKLENQLELPAGYYIRYGGAFENFNRATHRLKIIIPLALGLVFLLIFLSLKSLKHTLMIYISIPLATIGGILSLWFRDMPFSISAGIGFIVLFGVAVLNGLILISSWNELKKIKTNDTNQFILLGAKRRIRPVLLTALTDILGFFPMAISNAAGAEVQKPLATVLIGGIFTSTFLTLFILPILYRWLENKRNRLNIQKPIISIFLILIILIPSTKIIAQGKPPSKILKNLDEVINIGLSNNGLIKISKKNIELQKEEKKTAFNIKKTSIDFQYGQYNSFENDFWFGITQEFSFPALYLKQNKLAKEKIKSEYIKLEITENKLKKDIRKNWYELTYLNEKKKLLEYQDSIYNNFSKIAETLYKTKEISYLDKIDHETKALKINNAFKMIKSDIIITEKQLTILLNDTLNFIFSPTSLKEKKIINNQDISILSNNPLIKYNKQQVSIFKVKKKISLFKAFPEFAITYNNLSLIDNLRADGIPANFSDRFSAIQASIFIPLFYSNYRAKIKSSKIRQEIAKTNTDYHQKIIENKYQQQLQQIIKHKNNLEYYKQKAIPQANLIIKTAENSFKKEAISYIEYFLSINRALGIKFNYMAALNDYNQAIIQLDYIIGQ